MRMIAAATEGISNATSLVRMRKKSMKRARKSGMEAFRKAIAQQFFGDTAKAA